MIEQLKRRSAAEPENKTLMLNVVAAMAREERSSELVAPLMDWEKWNSSGEYAQELAALEVGRRIGRDWELSGMRVWSCGNRGQSPNEEELDERDTRYGHEWIRNQLISHRIATFTHKPTGIQFNLLPGRICIKNKWHDGPGSQRSCINPFLTARAPVTNDQAWRTHPRNGLGEDGMYDTDAAKGALPATGASFDEVKEYAESNGLSLPSPAQWQYACRAGSNTRFYWGDEFDSSHVWYEGNSLEQCGCPVQGGGHMIHCNIHGDMRRRPHAPAEHDKAGKWNSFGLVDMIGNVWEWNNDGKFSGFSFRDGQRPISGRTPMSWSGGDLANVGFRPIKTIDWSE